LDRLCGKYIQIPRVDLRLHPDAVKAQGNVCAFTQRDQPARSKRHLLPSNPNRRPTLSLSPQLEIDKTLMNVQFVLINDWPRSAHPPVFERAQQLKVHADRRADVCIRMG
jgi:hypothetical protein